MAVRALTRQARPLLAWTGGRLGRKHPPSCLGAPGAVPSRGPWTGRLGLVGWKLPLLGGVRGGPRGAATAAAALLLFTALYCKQSLPFTF